MELIIKFLILTFIVSGVVIFLIRIALFSSSEGVVQRLNEENKKIAVKQEELNKKILQANEELAQKQKEARELASKMRADAEQESVKEKEKIIAKARAEGEEIIAKAQGAKEKIRMDLEKENDIRVIKYSMEILNDILSQKAKGAFNETLIEEFLEKLKDTDMSRISPDITTVDVVTLDPVSEKVKERLSAVIKEKTGRSLKVNASLNPKIGGGLILKFGSMALDGSIQNLIREKALEFQQNVQSREI